MRRLPRGEQEVFSHFWGFRLGGVCSVLRHNYWRIPESPNGICLNCGRVAQGKLSDVHRDAEYRKARESWESEPRICVICGKDVRWSHHAPTRFTFDEKVVCCYEHKVKHERAWMLSISPDNGGTRETLPFYCSWSLVQIRILVRDNDTCQQCGATETNTMLRSDLEVHHIIFRRDGGSDHPANLKTLCHNCHTVITTDDIRRRMNEEKFKNIPKLESFL